MMLTQGNLNGNTLRTLFMSKSRYWSVDSLFTSSGNTPSFYHRLSVGLGQRDVFYSQHESGTPVRGIEPRPLGWKPEILTTRPHGTCLFKRFFVEYNKSYLSFLKWRKKSFDWHKPKTKNFGDSYDRYRILWDKKTDEALPGFEPGISCLLDRRFNR